MLDRICDYLKEQNRAVDAFELADALALPIEQVSAALSELLAQGRAFISKKGKYAAPETLGLIPARAVILRSGTPYARPLDGSPDIKLSRAGELRAMHGDMILVRRSRERRTAGAELCELAAVTQRATDKLIGVLKMEKRFVENKPTIVRRGRHKKLVRQAPEEIEYLSAQPCDLHVACGIEVTGATRGALVGATVVLHIVEWPRRHTPLKAEIVRVLGHGLDIGVQMDALIESHGLPVVFPGEALEEAAALPDAVATADTVGRFDARDIPLFTIDGDDAKDFDDAVSLEKTDKGWRLGVHIADVSHYVKKGGAIDREALKRGTSVYLPGRTLPMLPEKLCNDLCSLMPDVDRLAMSLFLDLEGGRVSGVRLENSVIHSRARLTYGEVNKLFDGQENTVPEALRPILFDMDAVARQMRERRYARGSIDFDLPEPELTLDETGYPVDVQARVRGEAERVIEDFMLAANEAVAEMARACHLPFLYRVHEQPDPDRLANLALFLANMNIPSRLGREPHPRQLQALLEETAGLPESAVIKHQLLRSLKRACYMAEPLGHYGLAARDYCHFTSPIRRYPDLTVHRMLKLMLAGQIERAQQCAGAMEELAAQTSQREFEAASAERDADDLVKAYYMRGREGEEFDGVVSGVHNWGFFVELPNTVEGLVRTRDLSDYYDFDEDRQCLTGERTRRMIRLGDSVRVLLTRVDTMACEIDFIPLWENEKKG